ncbi:E3 ubiquitin-protein ligase HECTD1 [Aphis craccivora]|uniref:E3 ubiquitin-protein ligase HECTD1 n=1 Tax=Aphis craccivora TaxID=307492 RepID=A0A6G0YI78_APHCR|nr:E3 ubiquitin-protein ligase HECTD1 [Aphis craccivora]
MPKETRNVFDLNKEPNHFFIMLDELVDFTQYRYLKINHVAIELSGRVLNESDLFDIDDDQAMFIQDFKMLILAKQTILLDQSLSDEEKKEKN